MPFTRDLTTTKRKGLHIAATASFLALMLSTTTSMVCAQSGSREANDNAGKSASIEGSWIFTIDVVGQPLQFNSLISFTAGGVVVTSPSSPATAPFYGIWKEKESKSSKAVFYTFVLDSTGKAVGTGKLNLLLHLTSRNELAGTGVGSACDLQGENCLAQADFEFTGKRIILGDGSE